MTPSELTKREWMVGQLVASPWFASRYVSFGGQIPPLKELWTLADRILEAQEKERAEKSDPPTP